MAEQTNATEPNTEGENKQQNAESNCRVNDVRGHLSKVEIPRVSDLEFQTWCFLRLPFLYFCFRFLLSSMALLFPRIFFVSLILSHC